MKRLGASSSGFTVIAGIVAAAILMTGLIVAIQLFNSTNTSYMRVVAGNVLLGIDGDFKIAITRAMKAYFLRALATPVAPSVDCQAKPAFFTDAAAASSAAVTTLNGLTLTLLSSAAQTALNTSSPDPVIRSACSQATAAAYCGTGTAAEPWVSAILTADDVNNRSIQTISALCFCTRLTATSLSPATAQLAQLATVSPIYVWFRWRERYVKDGLTKTCSAVRALADNTSIVNVLEYTIFSPSPRKSGVIYKQTSGIYLTSGLQ